VHGFGVVSSEEDLVAIRARLILDENRKHGLTNRLLGKQLADEAVFTLLIGCWRVQPNKGRNGHFTG